MKKVESTVKSVEPADTVVEAIADRTVNARAAAEKRRKEVAEAKDQIREIIKAGDPSIPDSFLALVKVLVPLKRRTNGPRKRVSSVAVLRQLMPNVGDTVSLLDVFKQFKMGEGEMRSRIRQALNHGPEERLWVSYDPATETYTLEGVGREVPATWKGELPKAL